MTDDARAGSSHTPHVLEVVTRLGDSIIDVTHLAAPGRRSRRAAVAYAVVALGVAGLAVAGLSFGRALHTAEADADSYAEWVAARRPAYAFRAHVSDPVRDVTALVCAGLGVALLAFGVPRARRRGVPRYRMGTAPGVELPHAGAPATSFPLLAAEHDGFMLHVAPGMDGELVDANGRRALAEVAAAVQLAPGTQASIRLGAATVAVAVVEPARRHERALFGAETARFAAYIGGALAAHLFVLALLETLIVPEGEGDDDLLDVRRPAATALTSTVASSEMASHRRIAEDDRDPAPAPSLALAAMPGWARTRADQPTTAGLQLPTADEAGATTRGEAADIARRAGILGDSASLAAAIANVAGNMDDINNGFDMEHAAAGLAAAEGAPPPGLFGTSRRDFGEGGWGCGCMEGEVHGGGTGFGTIAIGAFESGYGRANGQNLPHLWFGDPLHGRHGTDPGVVVIIAPNTHGDRDKALIRRYIRRHLAEVQYCYEREQLSRPGIAGNLALHFVIVGNGHVVNATAPGFDERVGHCVADVVSHIEFPSTTGEGATEVNYPLTFRRP